MVRTIPALAVMVVLALSCAQPLLSQDAAADGRKKTEAVLASKTISVDFTAASLDQAVVFLREATGLNCIFTEGVSTLTPVTLSLKNVAAETALFFILETAWLAYTIDDSGTILIMTRDRAKARVVEKTYDISGLLTEAQSFPGEDLMTLWPRGPDVPVSSDSARGFDGDALVDLIRNAICRDVWDTGDTTIDVDGNRLVIKQTPAVQDRIGAFLRDLANVRRRQITVAGLIFEADAEIVPRLRQTATSVLPPMETVSLIDEILGSPKVKHAERFLVTCRDGQRVNMLNVTQHSYVRDLDPQIAGRSVVYQPIVDIVNSGISIDVRPVLGNGGKDVFIELRPTVASLEGPTTLTFKGHGIDLPSLDMRRVRTSVKVPNGGGLLFNLSSGQSEGTDLFFLCTASSMQDPSPKAQSPRSAPSRAEKDTAATKERIAKAKVNMQYDGATLDDAVKNIADQVGLNYVVDANARDVAREITISLIGVAADDALRNLLEPSGLDSTIVDGVLFVSTRERILSEGMTTRVYDVSDLLFTVLNFYGPRIDILPLAMYERQYGKVDFALPAGATPIADESLFVDRIKRYSPGGEAGWGWSASSQCVNGLLVVTHTEAMHAWIRRFLDAERSAQRKMVTIECKVASIGNASMNKIFAGDRAMTPILDEKRLAALTDAIARQEKSLIKASAVFHCFSGQRAHMNCGKWQTYIGDIGVQSGIEISAEDPIIGQTLDGMVIDIHPILKSDRIIEVTTRGVVSVLKGLREAKTADGLVIQHPDVKLCRVETTMEIPDGKTAVHLLGSDAEQTYVMLLTVKVGK